MNGDYDVIVAGLGAAGSAAALSLARRGQRVLGLDRENVPNETSSHHGRTRIFRLCYYEHPGYVPLLRRALEGWRELERASGERILHLPGGVFAGPEGGPVYQGMIAAADLHAITCDRLSRAGMLKRFPQFVMPDGHAGIFEPTAGYVLCERALAATISLARAAGATLQMRELVMSWVVDGEGVRVTTTLGTYRARRLILSVGAWMGELAALESRLTVTRQVIGWVTPPKPASFARTDSPVWAFEDVGGALFYGLPLRAGGSDEPGMKVGRHVPGEVVTDPAMVRRHVETKADLAPLTEFLRRRIPAAAGRFADSRVCLYTNTQDGNFIIDRHPAHEQVLVVSPCSGHGFKFAPALGEIIAQLTLDGRTELDISFLRLGRV